MINYEAIEEDRKQQYLASFVWTGAESRVRQLPNGKYQPQVRTLFHGEFDSRDKMFFTDLGYSCREVENLDAAIEIAQKAELEIDRSSLTAKNIVDSGLHDKAWNIVLSNWE